MVEIFYLTVISLPILAAAWLCGESE